MYVFFRTNLSTNFFSYFYNRYCENTVSEGCHHQLFLATKLNPLILLILMAQTIFLFKTKILFIPQWMPLIKNSRKNINGQKAIFSFIALDSSIRYSNNTRNEYTIYIFSLLVFWIIFLMKSLL